MSLKFAVTIQRLLSASPRIEACACLCLNGVQKRDMTTMSQQLKPVEMQQAESEQLTTAPKLLDPQAFQNAVLKSGINFFCGVPDSLLKNYCAVISETVSSNRHVITVNEGTAVAMATGYHLSTGKSAMVFLQNSGLGNIVNPMMSLASSAVYSIPMLLLVGWRGQPGVKDEPQHNAQGQITPQMLELMNIPCEVLPRDIQEAEMVLQRAADYMFDNKSAYSILVQSGTFSPFKMTKENFQFPMTREAALRLVVDRLESDNVVVSTTGMLSRELFEYRALKGTGHSRDFLTVGSMGHASSIAFSIAMQKPDRKVFCLDGDGAALMHMGSMATIGQSKQSNFKHIVFNNGAHDSVGGQLTVAGPDYTFSFVNVAKACGYNEAWTASNAQELVDCMEKLTKADGPVLLEIKIRLGNRADIGRPTRTPIQNKTDFMTFIENGTESYKYTETF